MSASNDVKIWNLDNKECINNIRIVNKQSIYCSFLKHITGIYFLVSVSYFQKSSIDAYYYNKGLAKKFLIEEKSDMYCLKTYNSKDSKNYILVGLHDLAL